MNCSINTKRKNWRSRPQGALPRSGADRLPSFLDSKTRRAVASGESGALAFRGIPPVGLLEVRLLPGVRVVGESDEGLVHQGGGLRCVACTLAAEQVGRQAQSSS